MVWRERCRLRAQGRSGLGQRSSHRAHSQLSPPGTEQLPRQTTGKCSPHRWTHTSIQCCSPASLQPSSFKPGETSSAARGSTRAVQPEAGAKLQSLSPEATTPGGNNSTGTKFRGYEECPLLQPLLVRGPMRGGAGSTGLGRSQLCALGWRRASHGLSPWPGGAGKLVRCGHWCGQWRRPLTCGRRLARAPAGRGGAEPASCLASSASGRADCGPGRGTGLRPIGAPQGGLMSFAGGRS